MSSVAIAPRTQSTSCTVLTEADLSSVFTEADLAEGPLTLAEALEGRPSGLLIDGAFVTARDGRTLVVEDPASLGAISSADQDCLWSSRPIAPRSSASRVTETNQDHPGVD